MMSTYSKKNQKWAEYGLPRDVIRVSVLRMCAALMHSLITLIQKELPSGLAASKCRATWLAIPRSLALTRKFNSTPRLIRPSKVQMVDGRWTSQRRARAALKTLITSLLQTESSLIHSFLNSRALMHSKQPVARLCIPWTSITSTM